MDLLVCTKPSWWQYIIIISLVAGSGMAVASTGVGFAGIATTLVPLILAGATLDGISAALGAHIAVVSGSLGILGSLIMAIEKVLGC